MGDFFFLIKSLAIVLFRDNSIFRTVEYSFDCEYSALLTFCILFLYWLNSLATSFD